MSKARRERIILGLLFAVLALAGWNLWRNNFRPSGSLAGAGRGASIGEGADMADMEEYFGVEIGSNWAEAIPGGDAGRDPFRYGGGPAPTPPRVPDPPPPPQAFTPPPRAVAPPPPPLPVTYVGYSRVGGASAELKAVLIVDANPPMPVVAGDTLLGQYRIEEVTEAYVIVEDLQSGRRERLLVNLPD